ncbi:MAG: WhiB family transcriptional regulator, partial [Rhodococcus sp. (in: high G+C Gram-positive bacteria)]
RSHALSANEPYGVWGGMSAHDRADHYRAEARLA